MRTILLGDIVAAARALLPVPIEKRAALLDAMIQQSHAAHAFYKRMRKPHPDWGNGSLMARANLHPQKPEPYASDIEFLQCIQMVVSALISRKNPDAV